MNIIILITYIYRVVTLEEDIDMITGNVMYWQ